MERNAPRSDGNWHPMARVVVSLGTGIALAYAAAFLLFAGLVAFSGCFLECRNSNPNPLLGSFLVLTAVAAGGGVITSIATAIAGSRAPLKAVFVSSCVVLGALLFVAFVNG